MFNDDFFSFGDLEKKDFITVVVALPIMAAVMKALDIITSSLL